MKHCNPATYQIIKVAKRKKEPAEIAAIAYKVVDRLMMRESPIRQLEKAYQIWDQGVMCLFAKNRIRPIVAARRLAIYEMLQTGYTLLQAGNYFGLHYTSSIHAVEQLKMVLGQRHDSIDLDIAREFFKEVNL
jgi:hypothetical protein